MDDACLMHQCSFHGSLLACIATERKKYLFRLTIDCQLRLVAKILCQRHVAALQVHQVILFGQNILVIFGGQTRFCGQFPQIIPGGTSIFIKWCTGYIHIIFVKVFRITVGISHSVKSMPAIGEAKQLAYICYMLIPDIQSLFTHIYRFRMREIKQSGVIIIKHTGRGQEPHRPKAVFVLAYRSDLFGDEHSLVIASLQIYNHTLLCVHTITDLFVANCAKIGQHT